MTREDILKNPGYWTAKIQSDLYNHAEDFMEQNKLNRSDLAQMLGVSKGYVSQLLNGDYDHKISKFVELSLSFGFIPEINFVPIAEVVSNDRIKMEIPKWRPVKYSDPKVFEKSNFNISNRCSVQTSYSYSKTA